MSHLCPLCDCPHSSDYFRDKKRSYRQCELCQLVFVPTAERLSAAQEKAQYDLHENNPQDPAYRRFLSRLFIPMLEKLQPGSKGLDFGCGPGPALAMMFSEAGFDVNVYDPYYAPQTDVLHQRYDFITSTEVLEHLFFPGSVLQQLMACLKPGACFGFMTKLVTDELAFADWHYKNDPTHVCFWSRHTFQWLVRKHHYAVEFIDTDVIFLQKPGI